MKTRRIPNFQYEVNIYVGLNHEPIYSQVILAQNRDQAEVEVLRRAVDKMTSIAERVRVK